MAVVVEIDCAEETASGDEEVSGGPEETGGDPEADGSEPDITDTRLIGLRILRGISRSEYGWLGFGGRERGQRRGAVGAGRTRREEREGVG
jgi:hypothetical protein